MRLFKKRKFLLLSIAFLLVISLGGIVYYYWYENTHYVKTEDAQVDADLVNIIPQLTSKITEYNVEEGDFVVKNQILARQKSVSGTEVEKRLIRAAITGLVVKKEGEVGEIVSPDQTIIVLINPEKIYITANIKETDLNKIKVGNQVAIEIDEYPEANFKGKVKKIGLAANSAFSLLPNSTGGTFTKTVQRIPVKIVFDSKNYNLLPGTNAVVKIQLK